MQVDKQIPEIQSIVAEVLAMAKAKGATQAEASMSKVQGISVSTRMQEVETIEFNNDGGLGISVYVGSRKGSASTADLSKDGLALTVEKAIQIAKYTNEDKYTGLADAEMMIENPIDLELYYPQEMDTQQGVQLAIAAEQAAFEVDPDRIKNSDGSSYNMNVGARVYGNSHGVNVGFPSSRYSLNCVMIAQENGEMQRDYAYTVARDFAGLKTPAEVGVESAKNALSRLGGRKLNTMNVPVLFHRELASSLFGHFISAISGGSLYRKSSFLMDSLGTKVLPDWMNIYERPLIKKGLASSSFDNEGVRTEDMDIVTGGILNHYLLTSYSGRRLGMQTNGHAGGIHNWLIQDTGQSDEELLRMMDKGVLVTELMGHGVNTVTGDYSRGAAGFWVENGQIQYPVHEITIAGNLKDMLLDIQAIGAVPETRGSVQTGSILLGNMAIAGN
ncbi:metalloprotease PmbA [Paraneptunicella aestuarii]|uniref:metalloprotease PmbA n=1 Tax=Paraneptunicella aestuarii TaxID=2831148 RepID=UPI001E5D5E7D|nr:metalloprotease PmbA [Paraneptunicella aestuarii]UAA39113.1 metalloprotease PmbA [Paraneptunicella aestuarii]